MLSHEDKGDVKKAFGKAMANKIARATNDKKSSLTKWKSHGEFGSAMEAISHPSHMKYHSSLRRETKLKREARRGPKL